MALLPLGHLAVAEKAKMYRKETLWTVKPAELRHIFRRKCMKAADHVTGYMRPANSAGEERRTSFCSATCCPSPLQSLP